MIQTMLHLGWGSKKALINLAGFHYGKSGFIPNRVLTNGGGKGSGLGTEII